MTPSQLRFAHRGVQWLEQDKIHIGSKQKRYVFSPKFQVRFNTAFKETLIGCADLGRQGQEGRNEDCCDPAR